MTEPDPLLACVACPRLAAYLAETRAAHPDHHARPVPAWGPEDAPVLVVGLAPGPRGANRTGRPFCGDRSGVLVYGALHAAGMAVSPDPGSELVGARITNAVKCCPPKNLPTPAEVRTCRDLWLVGEVQRPRVIVALGAVAHASVLAALGLRAPFTHGAEHPLGEGRVLLASYHPSPQVTQTGRMSTEQFSAVFARARELIHG